MGLTGSESGLRAIDRGLRIRRRSEEDRVVALAGNPNVGKSTVFNGLTGMNQHTGNWPGKTVTGAQGVCESKKRRYILVDIPGTYSLLTHSAEEEVARNFICFARPDAVVVVCDATCLERNMNLVLQTLEISPRVIVCVNLMDEAKRKHIRLDLALLSRRLGVPVVGVTARKKKSLARLLAVLDEETQREAWGPVRTPVYDGAVEAAIAALLPLVQHAVGEELPPRWLSLKLLEGDEALLAEAEAALGRPLLSDPALMGAVTREQARLAELGLDADRLRDRMAAASVSAAAELCRGVVRYEKEGYDRLDRRLDKVLTGRVTAYPLMLLLLALVFWLTVVGANTPSQWLSRWLFGLQGLLTELCGRLGTPDWLHGALVLGVYRVLAWVVSVMLPPMAIFFPLFTLLEDAGYLPRIAYNLDKSFKRCGACGKQALTMCMGFGCNAAGIVGCRIIDSPRERLLAVLTNNFVPCNGRFPLLITLLTIFFVGTEGSAGRSALTALLMTGLIVFAVGATMGVTRLLSRTLLRGTPSSFALELPPYRRPQIGRVILRSLLDRTAFVLGRAAAVAAPAGLLIWLLANVRMGEASLLTHCAGALDPFARLMGLDGVILLAFVLGFPANEIVIPIAVMAYTAQGTLVETGSLGELRLLLMQNGWSWATAVSVMLFSLLHWPCSTALLTVRKETGSWKWTLLAAAIPTALGVGLCVLFTAAVRLLGLA